MIKNTPQPIVDSRHLKILSVKKDELKDSIVFVCLEDKHGYYDVAQLRKLAEALDRIEPNGNYFIGLKRLRFEVYDRAEIKNKDIIVTVANQEEDGMNEQEVEKQFRQTFSEAKSISFVHHYAEVEKT